MADSPEKTENPEKPENLRKKKGRKIRSSDFQQIAQQVQDMLQTRRQRRANTEKVWDDIDRQLRMQPDISFKKIPNKQGQPSNSVDPNRAWMSETELPLQTQTLEVLGADARRFLFSTQGPWYRPHANMSDEYLEKADVTPIISGDKAEVPSELDQTDVNNLVRSFGDHFRKQYDFRGNIDLINADAFSYGMGIGRVRMVQKRQFSHTDQGSMQDKRLFPVLVPRSIKNVYLDDTKHHLMHEGHIIGPNNIQCKTQLLSDVLMAASNGNSDPMDDVNGGWLPKHLNNIEADDEGNVEVVELEGDLLVQRKASQNLYLPNCIVTVVKEEVIRFRWNTFPFSSYLEFPYEKDFSGYGSSPLIKGWPIQLAAAQALNRLMDAAALKNSPPGSYDPSDAALRAVGGPVIAPYEMTAAMGDINLWTEVGGDPSTMASVFSNLVGLYYDVTGVNPPRLGEKTSSHTTATAKTIESEKGVSRTVDYVRSIGRGPLSRFLYMEYELGRDQMKAPVTMRMEGLKGGWVDIEKKHLPEIVEFEWLGSGGPQDEAQKRALQNQATREAVQLDLMSQQAGNPPVIDLPSLINKILEDGQVTDMEDILAGREAQGQAAPPNVAATGLQSISQNLAQSQ